ncbi:uncharacterized protein cubi_00717 [Cryptosporidium ubiquitum]|uniref:Uncharacterized protein n=1 Tax=Cryptosporidium ubiquitum TaxID=857276 RepID=A0A1J4MGC1_9CRYT|nr:uncharacterized protein cubi_00717 [Cryptosporidium ubiquitum]OII71909.1 hypothetical protein cubi_00717 [Cryptosporidium ubiquitum]
MIRMRLVALLFHSLVLVSISYYIITELNNHIESGKRMQQVLIDIGPSQKSNIIFPDSEKMTGKSVSESEDEDEEEGEDEGKYGGKDEGRDEDKDEVEAKGEDKDEVEAKDEDEDEDEAKGEDKDEGEEENPNQNENEKTSSSNIFKSFEDLPGFIKIFQNHLESNFSKPCQNYWNESLKLSISKYKNTNYPRSFKLSPTLQTEEILNYLSGTTINEDNTMIRIRIKYIFDSQTKKIIQFEPIISCIKDSRIPKPKPSRLKIRDVNHTIKYMFKAIKEINKESKNRNLSQNNIRFLDVLIHYDDCPIIWNSMPFHIYNNDTLHLEKCILNSKFSKLIQFLISNSTEIHHIIPSKPINSKYNFSSIFNNSNNFNNKYPKVLNDSLKSLPSYYLSFNPPYETTNNLQGNNYYNYSRYSSSNNNHHLQSQNKDDGTPPLNNSNRIFSSLINGNLQNHIICNEINNFVEKIISKYSLPGIMCSGNIQCYIPCFFKNNLIFSSIFDKLKKRDTSKLFNHLHCICKFINPSSNPESDTNSSSGLILSISSHLNSWDFASIPYVNHLDNSEITARSFIYNYSQNNTNLWNLKNNTLFFIGRYTDISRLDLSCDIYNLLHNKFENISNQVFISDSNKISCENRANLLEKLTFCESSFICRKESISFNNWISKSIFSKFSLDLSGVGPWSNRLRILMLTGAMIFQNVRSYHSHQFYDLIFKKNNLFFKFNNPNDIFLNINSILENPQISSNISKIVSNFAINCLSEDGITNYYKTLLLELGYWDLDSYMFNNTHYSLKNFTEIQFFPKDSLETIRNKIETCIG